MSINFQKAAPDLPPREVIIQLKEEDRLLVVDGGRSILDAALKHNLGLRHSCNGSPCVGCNAFLVDGEVKMNNPDLITYDIRGGHILLCQTYPASDNVIVRPLHQDE